MTQSHKYRTDKGGVVTSKNPPAEQDGSERVEGEAVTGRPNDTPGRPAASGIVNSTLASRQAGEEGRPAWVDPAGNSTLSSRAKARKPGSKQVEPAYAENKALKGYEPR